MTELSRDEVIRKSTKEDSYWRGVWRRLKQNKLAMISLFILILIVGACIFVPMFSKYSMYEVIATDIPGYRLPLKLVSNFMPSLFNVVPIVSLAS